jgi:Zn-dependent protease
MFGSGAGIRLFYLRGIPVDLDATALILILFYAVSIASGSGLLVGIGVALGIVLSILIHEISHALVGSSLGARVAGIRLHVLGGATFFAYRPSSYWKDMLTTAAGPASNFVLWQLFQWLANTVIDGASRSSFQRGSGLLDLVLILSGLSTVNFFLGVFNSLPGYPLDGGQVVHSFLMWVTRRERLAAAVVMVLGCLSAVGILYYYTNGFRFNAGTLSIGLIFALFIAYWIASSSIALYQQATPNAKPRPTPRQQEDTMQKQAAERAKTHAGYRLFEQGRGYLLSREYAQAIECFSRALQAEPDELNYLDYRAYTFAQMDNFERAIADYNVLIERAPRRADFYTARAQSYIGLGNLQAASADIEQALQINPTEGLALQLKQQLAQTR